MATKEKSTFSHFFKEDAEHVQDIIFGDNGKQKGKKAGVVKKEIFPTLKRPKEVSDEEFKKHWQAIRSFFRNGENKKGLPKSWVPVLMSPLYTKGIIGSDFPVWVNTSPSESEESCLSLREILKRKIGEEDETHILRENIDRIVHLANGYLTSGESQPFTQILEQALVDLEKALDVSGDESVSFDKSLKDLKESLPKDGVLLPYSNNTSFQLLDGAMSLSLAKSRAELKENIIQLKCRLNDILRVDREKGPERKKSDKMQDSLEFADSMMDFDKLTAILPGGGSESMSPKQVARIKKVVSDLELGEALLDQKGFVFVDPLLYSTDSIHWDHLFDGFEVKPYKKGKGCNSISSTFEQHIEAWTKLFSAIRIGELEFKGRYQADVHDDFFDHFHWDQFSSEELINCPHFFLIADDEELFKTEFNQLTEMLTDNIPVRIVAVKHDDQLSNENEEAELHTHAELGGLMLSHKNIFVTQSSSITPMSLFQGYLQGISSFAPAFFYILNVDPKIHENAYLWTSGMVESRDFPGFTYNGLLGTSWGSRFSVQNNPQAELTWPAHKLTIINADGDKEEVEFPFTFAHQAVLNPAYHHYFLPVPASCWSESLVSLPEFMEKSTEENIGNVPFIWMMDSKNELQKVAVSWPIVLAVQERLDFWRFLQENSGINNYHVAQAVEKTRDEMKEVLKNEMETLKTEHEQEIQTIKEEEAGKVMENLASVLLNLDATNVVATNINVTTSKSTEEEIEDEAPAVVDEPPEEDTSLLSNDPYIDTALCTSCNDCTELNGAMFKYNADKMAYIADATAGTFSQLVEAAEKCPVSIIHPGSPLNPDEPDMESLIERAEKFN